MPNASLPIAVEHRKSHAVPIGIGLATLLVLGLLVWQGLASRVPSPIPVPAVPQGRGSVAAIDIAILVFREGLESILVLSAITASLVDTQRQYRRPIAAGAAVGFIATLLTWSIVVAIIDDLSTNIPALDIQAATGLLAIVVLLVVMNWFFHKVYWTGWISLHTRKKRQLVNNAGEASLRSVLMGFALLGFSSMYREGFEVVLFLQSYRLRAGGTVVLEGVLIGAACTVLVAILTFFAHRRLPYKKMLVLTGTLLGIVLLVMVGEQGQEMQQAQWIPTTVIPWLEHVVPDWMGLWFSIFPTYETLSAQLVAAVLVVGSYVVARRHAAPSPKRAGASRSVPPISAGLSPRRHERDPR